MSNASFETEDRIAVDASARAEDARQAGAEPLNGNGFYRFKIGDFQATVISDGQGPIPVSPILVMNASEAELAPVLRANFMEPVIQATNNPLVVDTGRERILVDTGFGEKIGPPFGSFPRLEENLGRARFETDSAMTPLPADSLNFVEAGPRILACLHYSEFTSIFGQNHQNTRRLVETTEQ